MRFKPAVILTIDICLYCAKILANCGYTSRVLCLEYFMEYKFTNKTPEAYVHCLNIYNSAVRGISFNWGMMV